MPHNHEILEDMREPVRQLRAVIPDVFTAYVDMRRAVMTDGALPGRIKELIALAIAVTRECDGCIASHARGAVRQKATPEEVAEAMGVTILMNGGPGTVWGPRALEAYREFAAAPG